MRRASLAIVLASLLAACATTASNGEPGAHAAEPAGINAPPASCETVADCAGKPFRPNFEMCMRGSSVQLQCRNHLCVQACAPTP